MGWFDSRSRAERTELKKAGKRKKSIRESARRDEEIGVLQDKARLAKAKKEKRLAEREEWRSRFPKVTVKTPKLKKKKQSRKLGGRRKIGLI